MKDIYVEFGSSSDIKGETNDNKHKAQGAIEVSSFTHLIRQPKSATASSAGGHTAERTEHGELVFTKDIDKATPKLLQACSAGTIYKSVVIYFYRALGGASNNTTTGSTNPRVNYLKIELKNALVSSVASTISDESVPVETFGLKYSAIRWTYNQSSLDGGGSGGVASGGGNIAGSWDLAGNSQAFPA